MLPSGELILYELKKEWLVLRGVGGPLPEKLPPPLLW